MGQATRILSYSEDHLEMRERAISANELLSWAEACTVETEAHPYPSSGWNFSARFPDLPFIVTPFWKPLCFSQGRKESCPQAGIQLMFHTIRDTL